MKIAIIIHTSTGHTLKFAQAIRDALESNGNGNGQGNGNGNGNDQGHEVDLIGLRTQGSVTPAIIPGGNNFTIKNPPDLSEYDAVLVGGPVWAFKPSPVIMKYLVYDVKKLKGKKALSFVTMGLAGGRRAIRKMDEELDASGAEVLEGEILVYRFGFNQKEMFAAVDRICKKLGAR